MREFEGHNTSQYKFEDKRILQIELGSSNTPATIQMKQSGAVVHQRANLKEISSRKTGGNSGKDSHAHDPPSQPGNKRVFEK